MNPSAVSSRAVLRACVVTAVREGEQIMDQLVKFTLDELGSLEAESRAIAKRDLAIEAAQLLRVHQPALVKAYPMVLLEMVAEGSEVAAPKPALSAALDIGELSLVDDDEVQAQVELSRAQQLALHTTDEILTQLNGLVSAAQGLRWVQPERNPLRPENYIRALQRAVADTQVVAPIREAWMQHMRAHLGQQLVGVYERAVQGLREHGVQQVGWGGRQNAHSQAGSSSGWSGTGGAGPGTGWAPASAWGHGVPMQSGYREPGVSGYAASDEEALLTVGILRQMLVGAGDPYQQLYVQPGAPGSAQAVNSVVHDLHGHGGAEAMQDIAELERLVGRLTHSQQASLSGGAGAPHNAQGSRYGSPEAAPMGAEVVARMVENITQDARLLQPVKQAVQDLEPAIRKLIRYDTSFFTDANHPARRLLDDITERSLEFADVDARGFDRFMRLVDQAVAHLSKTSITGAAPFETVRRALHAAWDVQKQKRAARQERERQAQQQAEELETRAGHVAAEIGAMPEFPDAPQDVVNFVLGPWSDVVAALPVQADGTRGPQAASALSVVPLLLWSVQPELAQHDPQKLDEATMLLPVRLRTELENIGYPQEDIDAFLKRLAELHRVALATRPPDIELPSAVDRQEEEVEELIPGVEPDDQTVLQDPPELEEPEVAGPDAPTQPSDGFVIGVWVELITSGKRMYTQLTWCSPHNTLFLFSAPDGSTQSMTRRMRDKLVARGALQLVDSRLVAEASGGSPLRRSN